MISFTYLLTSELCSVSWLGLIYPSYKRARLPASRRSGNRYHRARATAFPHKSETSTAGRRLYTAITRMVYGRSQDPYSGRICGLNR